MVGGTDALQTSNLGHSETIVPTERWQAERNKTNIQEDIKTGKHLIFISILQLLMDKN